ncbi:MAG TPA: hypothetical protein V6D03_14400 [Candidatus Caenarcaniphilales bacterium]
MKSLTSPLVVLGSVCLILLGACSNSNPATSPGSPAAPSETSTEAGQAAQSGAAQAGGQVLESGPYHLEFVSEQEDEGTHLDFYLQKGDTHEAIPDAKVTAQVQLPDGQQKTLNLTYDSQGKHYTALLPQKAVGEYQVAILSNIKGEQVNGRFAFSQ